MTVVLKGGMIASGRVMNHGDELVVTEEIRALNTDRNGVTWLTLLDNVDGQVQRWGRQVIARGPWPERRSKLCGPRLSGTPPARRRARPRISSGTTSREPRRWLG